MAKKSDLRKQRINTIVNLTSKEQEKSLNKALLKAIENIEIKFDGIKLLHEKKWLLKDVVGDLKKQFPKVGFHFHKETSFMQPDGGILYIVDKQDKKYPILISEKKNQGTNNLRAQEGLKKQAQGNAIERLGKNVIGFRAALKSEAIFPFVCFGDGCDFSDGSSILDRVATIAQFGELNISHLHNEGLFERGSFYFREEEWTETEMVDILVNIAINAIYYYFSKYGEGYFMEGVRL